MMTTQTIGHDLSTEMPPREEFSCSNDDSGVRSDHYEDRQHNLQIRSKLEGIHEAEVMKV